jgi:putative phosphoesterase
MRLGLVSDTHGLLDEELRTIFAGCDRILHGGDLVEPAILSALEEIAPVTAVRGNNDHGPLLERLPETALVAAGVLTVLVVHDLGPRERPKAPAGRIIARERPEIVVHGHSHRPGSARIGETLFVNPGSAGPRRFSLPRTAAVLEVRRRKVRLRFVDLSGTPPAPLGADVEAEL